MTEASVHFALVVAMFVLAGITVIAVTWITAPYGRHYRDGWGPTLSNRVGWVVMEAPASLVFLGIYLQGAHRLETTPLVLLALWQLHYVQRAFVYPLRLGPSDKRMPWVVVLSGVAFNLLNAYVNARWISQLGDYPDRWLRDPRFLLGAGVFLVGWVINFHADSVLLRLRAKEPGRYGIPRGGLYGWVSCPNYLGELLEWTGWALCTWSFAGLAFAVYTAANLVPRAISNHRWYHEKFGDYPETRTAILPYLV